MKTLPWTNFPQGFSDHAFGVCGGEAVCEDCRRYSALQRWRDQHPITHGEIRKQIERSNRRRDEYLALERAMLERRRRLNEMKAAKALSGKSVTAEGSAD